jgi:hypothetical protein
MNDVDSKKKKKKNVQGVILIHESADAVCLSKNARENIGGNMRRAI